jgi:tetratricopeptide (TPR) repeat protein
VVVVGAVVAIVLMRHPYWGTGKAARERFDAIDAARAAQVEKKAAQTTEATPPPAPAPGAAAVAEPVPEPAPAAPVEVSAASTPKPTQAAPEPATTPAPAAPEPAAPATETEADTDAYQELLTRAQKAQRRGRGREARKLLDRALAANPQGDEALALRAWVALDTGNGKEAVKWADKALAVNADNARAHLVKGVRLHELKRTAEAKSHYERYLELEPKGEHASEVRRTLRGL